MKQEIQEIRNRILENSEKIRYDEKTLQNAVKRCEHKWGGTKDASYWVNDYSMTGVTSANFPFSVTEQQNLPKKIVRKWVRVCEDCGLEQETEKFETKSSYVPIWPDSTNK